MAELPIRWHPSDNFGPRRDGIAAPRFVVLHYTAMHSAEAAIERLCDPAYEVSAHYVIARDGQITGLVKEELRAWHAGAGCWAGLRDMNSHSIGIELDNDGASPFSEPLMQALCALLTQIMARWQIPPERVVGHSDLAPLRKCDPGVRFDWRRLALSGLAIWPDPAPAPERPLGESLSALGYAVELHGLEACLQAFRARFRPGAGDGPARAEDGALAAGLAARFGVDRMDTSA